MKKLFLVALVSISLFGCSSSSEARRVLEANGYTSIETTGHKFFACSEDDVFSTGFEATSPNGTRVSGAVCSGWLKGATIRF